MSYGPLPILATSMATYGVEDSSSLSGGHKHLLCYNLDYLSSWGALGGIFELASIFRLRQQVMYQLVAHFILFIVCYYAARGFTFGEDLAAVKELSRYVNSMVAFLLGLFMSLCISRWWDLRSKFLHGTMDASRE